MALLSRDEILNSDDRVYEKLSVPEWGGEVIIRSLTGRERDAFEASLTKGRGQAAKPNLANFRARMVALCLVDENHQLQFNRDDIDALGRKSVKALQRVFNKCNEMNGMSEGDIEDLTSDFDAEADGASTSD